MLGVFELFDKLNCQLIKNRQLFSKKMLVTRNLSNFDKWKCQKKQLSTLHQKALTKLFPNWISSPYWCDERREEKSFIFPRLSLFFHIHIGSLIQLLPFPPLLNLTYHHLPPHLPSALDFAFNNAKFVYVNSIIFDFVIHSLVSYIISLDIHLYGTARYHHNAIK